MDTKTIIGTVVRKNLGIGFWGIVGDDGVDYRPVNMPEQLKKKGKKVTITAELTDDMSIFMWGTAIKIISFET